MAKPLIAGLLLLGIHNLTAQDTLMQKRLKPLLIATGAGYALTMAGLNQLWYADFERESFHFFNDHNEWKQIDKVGHFYAGFQLSSSGYKALRWAGVEEGKAILYGTLFSVAALTPIEIFDGFSSAYGASYTDLIANTTGGALFYFQQKNWGTIKVHPKFSFKSTHYPNLRPNVLGSTWYEEIIKDYNGQSYWLSLDISKFLSGSNFPKWLNLAIGYGAGGMIYANDHENMEAGFTPKRQYYVAFDLDFNEYHSKSKLVNTLIHFVNMVHIPAPTLEYSDGFKFHFIY